MKVSIITVCLNSAATLEQTINSVLSQTYTNIEYIIIDGGSTDGTIDIIKKYESQISCWISEPDRGLYDAMNKGIERATGDIIGIINSDDWYELSTVEKVLACFCSTNADLVHGNRSEFSDADNTTYLRTPELRENYIFFTCAYLHPTVFVKSEIYKKYGAFNCKYKVCADYEFLLRLYAQGVRIHYLPEILTHFRVGGFSRKHGWKLVREMHHISRTALRSVNIKNKDWYVEEEKRRFMQTRKYRTEAFIDQRISKEGDRVYIKNALKKDRIIIFGTGFWGIYFYKWCTSQRLDVKCFVDNSARRQQESLNGIEINHPRVLDEKDKNEIIIIAVKDDKREIEQQLNHMGFCYGDDYLFYDEVLEKVRMQYMEAKFSFRCAAKRHKW